MRQEAQRKQQPDNAILVALDWEAIGALVRVRVTLAVASATAQEAGLLQDAMLEART